MGDLIPSSVDAVDVKAAHEKIKDIENSMFWAVFKFKKGIIKATSTGTDFKSFQAQFSDKEVSFGYYRHEAGVFLLIVWAGQRSSPTDKLTLVTATPFLLAVIKTFADQLMTGKLAGVDLDSITKLVNKAKGLTKGIP
ncbi:uncharacterized protein [Haliotis asinina]|uniref:uncharacterized protein n=1 Tax=Haliotis asinina TaxID=109174 RepID=UPI003531D231